MTEDEALDLALEALLWANIEINDWRDDAYGYKPEDQPQIMEAITAIKQARALDKKAENARELGLDYEPVATLFGSLPVYDITPQPAPVQPVAFEVGLVEWVGNKLMATPKVTTTPPASWMEMVVANLVRQGIDKHKARELAEHFYGLARPAPVQPVAIALNTGTKQGVKWLKNVEHGVNLYTTPPAAQPAPTQDIPDLIAGALGVSRGTAYDLMREALKEAY